VNWQGGASTSTFVEKEGFGVFNGTCRVVSFLHAPGFAKASTESGWFSKNKMNDASTYVKGHVELVVRSTTPNYQGFKVEIGSTDASVPHGRHARNGSFKADFNVTANSNEWQTIKVPFDGFSSDWSDFTGSCSTKDPGTPGTQHHCCSAAHPEVCPTAKALSMINSLAVWAEGTKGDFHIEIKSIAAAM